MTDAVDELAAVLFKLDADSGSTAATTTRITREIVRWAASRGWTARTEARLTVPGQPASGRLGIVDVIVRRGADEPALAVEIDSADKPWSIEKLKHAVACGMHAVWVRWGDDAWAGIYDGVDVIQLPIMRRRGPRARTPQLTLW